jgi:hypothetical protein
MRQWEGWHLGNGVVFVVTRAAAERLVEERG